MNSKKVPSPKITEGKKSFREGWCASCVTAAGAVATTTIRRIARLTQYQRGLDAVERAGALVDTECASFIGTPRAASLRG